MALPNGLYDLLLTEGLARSLAALDLSRVDVSELKGRAAAFLTDVEGAAQAARSLHQRRRFHLGPDLQSRAQSEPIDRAPGDAGEQDGLAAA